MLDRDHAPPRAVSSADLTIMRRIGELHLLDPFVGSRMLRDLLRKEGKAAGRPHVATLMKRMAQFAGTYEHMRCQLQRPSGHALAFMVVDGSEQLTVRGVVRLGPHGHFSAHFSRKVAPNVRELFCNLARSSEPYNAKISQISVVYKALWDFVRLKNGAGNGNRTRVFSLEGCCTTIVLYPLAGCARCCGDGSG
jgi:hypothetical protein